MMNKYERKLLWCAFVAYMSAPAIAYSTPWTNSDEPLWLGTSVKHNLMFAIDDSGSMDFEVLFDSNDGALYLGSDGFFANSNGLLNGVTGSKYVYLFPNGESGTYDGRRKNRNHYAIPPVPAYAFARSAAFNGAYYDPGVTYDPWPYFPEYSDDPTKDTFSVADTAATSFEPVTSLNGVGTLGLFANHDTADFTDLNGDSEDKWSFDVENASMVCDADGSTGCTVEVTDYEYYPGSYYLKDTSSNYYYHGYIGSVSSLNSTLLEAENATLSIATPTFKRSLDLALSVKANGSGYTADVDANIQDELADIADAQSKASGGDFIGTLSYENTDLATVPKKPVRNNGDAVLDTNTDETSATFQFGTNSGRVNIWTRVYSRSGSSDSFFVKLDGYDAGDVGTRITLGPDSDDVWPVDGDTDLDGDGEWNKYWQALTTVDNEWQWKLWATVNVNSANQTLEIRRREGGTYLDQILVTENLSFVPDPGFTSLPSSTPELRNCATDTDPSHYQTFALYPERFLTSTLSSSSRIDALAFDGSCLKKYEIGKTQADTEDFVNGAGVARTVLEEKQNFANWFMYYRKRHQAMRGGLASAVQGLAGINTGLFWINKKRTVGLADMFDMDTDAGIKGFLEDHLETVNGGGTKLRLALEHARAQYASSTGPVISECQKNYTLLFTDGYSTTESPSTTNSDELAGEPYADGYSGTLADIAFQSYFDLLRSEDDFPKGKVKVSSACANGTADPWEDCNTDLHMSTYTVGLGAKGTIFGVTHNDAEDAHNNPPVWPNVTADRDEKQIDDLYHAAVNGRGEMFSASTPVELADALDAALDDIVETIGSGSGVTFNSSSLQANDGTAIYNTLFNSSDWSGNVQGRALDGQSGTVEGSVWKDSSGEDAGVAELLDERDLTLNDRSIFTMGSADGVVFRWDNLTADQQADLKVGPGVAGFASGSDEAAQKRLDWIRGDMTINGLRDRGSRLGDIVHSAPVYVGTPSSPWPDADPFGFEGSTPNYLDRNRYSDFKNRTKSEGGAADRKPIVYVGSNDGMLHGFNGSNTDTNGGQEEMAYIPNLVYSTQASEGLHYLADPSYNHKYYVDASPVVQDIYSKGDASDTSADWRTVLIGGLRGGGKGIFALDVTYPDEYLETDANADQLVMWEFDGTSASDAANNLGYQLTPPAIAMMNNGKWAVIFGNGIDSIDGHAVLFIVFIEEGLDGTWTLDNDYMMIDTAAFGGPTTGNGLSGVAVADTNGDYMADRIYAGDIQGNMWAFDVSNATAITPAQGNNPEVVNWAVEDGAPLFVAQYSYPDPNDNNVPPAQIIEPQPIMAAPGLSFNSEQVTSNNLPNILVTFGTGQYLKKDDISDASVQSYYTVWDHGDKNLNRTTLTERTLVQDGTKLSLTALTDGNGDAIYPWNPAGGVHGWFFDFAPEVSGNAQENGERLINKPLLAPDKDLGPVAIFASMIPDSSECSGGGSSVLYALPLLTGLNPDKAIADLNGDGVIDSGDMGIGVTKDDLINDPNRLGQYLYGSKGDSTDVDVTETTIDSSGEREGRLGWFELIDD